ncbi:LysR family transcriptional regulator, partial [Pseudomonas sp. MAFF212428]|nr:LysR family transcriptional regulator [Pseudomonas brassicae]
HKLGCTLFVRHPRGVHLTPAGDAFLTTARATLSTLHEGVTQAREVAAGIAGHLRVGSLALAGYPHLLQALRGFRQAWPKVRISLLQQPSAQLADGLLKGELDIAFMRHLPDLNERLHAQLILDEPLLLAVPADHPLAQAPRVRLAEVADEDFVFTPPALGNGFHQHLLALCERAGFSPRLHQQAAQMQTLVSLVACGFGVALVPSAVAQANQQAGVSFRALEQNPTLGLYMTTRRDAVAPPARRLAELLGSTTAPCPPR